MLTDGKTDVWDSGKVNSGQSLNVKYAGPAVKPSTRYWWRVEVWGRERQSVSGERGGVVGDGASEPGLARRVDRLGDDGRSRGAEGAVACGSRIPMLCRERRSRTVSSGSGIGETCAVEKPVERAILFATGEDTVAAWVNGERVMTVEAYPPYHHLPWKKFVRADVTAQVAEGQNTIAIESMHYIDKYGEKTAKGCSADDRDGGAAL